MSNFDPYQSPMMESSVAHATSEERAQFISRTYAHLAGAVLLFVLIEALAFMFTTDDQRRQVVQTMMGSRWTWLMVLGGFIFVSWIADSWARSSTSLGTQYFGLGLYVVAEAIIFLPLLFLASLFAPEAISSAAIITGVVFGGLTAFVFATRSDLAGWGKYLGLFGLVAFGYIIVAMFLPQTLGLGSLFSGMMILLAAGYILYDTSNVLHHYNTNQHVAAALALFASVALLFWYILQLVLSFSSGD